MIGGLLHGLSRFFNRMPLERALAWGRGLGWIYGSVIRYHRADAVDALRRSFPEKTPAEIRALVNAMYANLGMNVTENLRLLRGLTPELHNRVEWIGRPHVDDALKRGRGLLILTAHMGNWELLMMYAAFCGYPLTAITKNLRQRFLHDALNMVRTSSGVRIVPARDSYRTCLKALKRNELIGFILDQNRPRSQGVFVDFFGRSASTTPGLALMAAHSGAPIVPAFMHRRPEPGRHVIVCHPPLDPPPNRAPETLRAATQIYTRYIEDEIRQYPGQWIWLHRRWRSRPPGEIVAHITS